MNLIRYMHGVDRYYVVFFNIDNIRKHANVDVITANVVSIDTSLDKGCFHKAIFYLEINKVR